jgi:hypothetical protein
MSSRACLQVRSGGEKDTPAVTLVSVYACVSCPHATAVRRDTLLALRLAALFPPCLVQPLIDLSTLSSGLQKRIDTLTPTIMAKNSTLSNRLQQILPAALSTHTMTAEPLSSDTARQVTARVSHSSVMEDEREPRESREGTAVAPGPGDSLEGPLRQRSSLIFHWRGMGMALAWQACQAVTSLSFSLLQTPVNQTTQRRRMPRSTVKENAVSSKAWALRRTPF